jgi:3-oxoacyl-[acyl-carrier protein] reductase
LLSAFPAAIIFPMKHHLITGAASGFGFGLARTLLARGDSVMACDINTAPMEQLRSIATAPAQLNIRQLDVRDPAQWEQTMQAAVQLWPRIDTVMNVAGVLRPDFIADIRLDDINLTFDVNTKGAIFGTQAAFRAMRNQADENGRGHIINLASMAGIAPLPGMSIYSASKFALRGYSLSIAQELKQHSISITVVCPSGADTPLVEPYKHKNQAALIFIAPLLTTKEVVRAVVDRALVKRPMEITLPRARGLLAKAAGSFPILAQRLAASMTRTGLRNQAKLK